MAFMLRKNLNVIDSMQFMSSGLKYLIKKLVLKINLSICVEHFVENN